MNYMSRDKVAQLRFFLHYSTLCVVDFDIIIRLQL